jgi:cell division protein FtsZ
MLVPENAPLVKPVNEFINPVKANTPAQPYIKQRKSQSKPACLICLVPPRKGKTM